ncbi:hypothetical protein C0991_002756 [Blastosporella zonata]|nr:hypothetical protein C0991_002756 [Blastosporella zonata]
MDPTALLAHILSQTKQNVEFLISQKQISTEIGREILSKLPNAPTAAEAALVKQTQNLTIPSTLPPVHAPTATPAYSQSYSSPPHQPPPAAAVTALPPGVLFRVKANWAYNEQGQVNPSDLSFRPGDIIDITAETNADWWTGRLNGRDGLFPANYVERVPNPQAAPPPAAPNAYSSPPAGFPGTTGYPSYASPATAPGGYGPPGGYAPPGDGYAPPSGYPPPSGYAPPSGYHGPPPPAQYAPYGAPPNQPPGKEGKDNKDKSDKKKNKLSGLGETMAQGAAGGVGFGVGSAIVSSIF